MKNKTLLVFAHPDDEILGAGATAAKLVKEKNEVFCLLLGGGVAARDIKNIEKGKKELIEQSKKAAQIIGFKEIFYEDFPDNKFDSVPLLDIVKKVEYYINKVKPDVIYTHYEKDLNVDHQKTFEAVMTACRPCNSEGPKEIYSSEVLSSTEWQSKNIKNVFLPTNYIDVSETIDEKIKAIQAYKSEIRDYPHSRSLDGIKILAQYRGLESGLKYAEAFILVRQIKK